MDADTESSKAYPKAWYSYDNWTARGHIWFLSLSKRQQQFLLMRDPYFKEEHTKNQLHLLISNPSCDIISYCMVKSRSFMCLFTSLLFQPTASILGYSGISNMGGSIMGLKDYVAFKILALTIHWICFAIATWIFLFGFSSTLTKSTVCANCWN